MIIIAEHRTIISICTILNLTNLMLINLVLLQNQNPVDGTFFGVDHCYSDIGCFPLSDEFYHPRHRPFNVRPWHRRRIKISFHLYSRKHLEGYELRAWNKLNLLHSGFNPMLETKIILPGWLDNIKRALWVRRMKDSFLWLWQPVNIIVLHWRNFTPYTIATANTRVVGAELANLLKSIEHELHYDRAYYHLIGHSLGAHIGGYCGDRMPGLGRITALDPARPFFQHMPKSVRLDRGDARFVDAIHSDFTPENAIFLLMSFGMTTPVGHVDFYPNGPPLLQPGCLRDTIWSVRNGIQRGLEHSSLSVAFLEATRYLTACDHQRSHEWFIESITNRQCVFIGVRCNTFEGLINGRCTCDNSRSACAIMGIHADQMYLNNAHKDLWPLGSSGSSSPADGGQSQLVVASRYRRQQSPPGKDQMYSRLKQQAEGLRKPPVPTVAHGSEDLFNEEEQAEEDENLNDIQEDSAFVDYLRSNIMPEPEVRIAQRQQQQRKLFTHPLKRPVVPSSSSHTIPTSSMQMLSDENVARTGDNSLLQRRQDTTGEEEAEGFDEDDLGLGHLLADNHANVPPPSFNGHPKLLSDIDRDIENWYEESSRWYLKTNNRPSYCVNQYQVLVFIGPLKTTTGHKHVRANLIISIIGSKGQLMNQRFVPRSANLDSFTMQPFFIILEGSYSLGNIVSVAIGWEARLDPEPIQATISFQSNLLEGAQSMLPSYQAKHPWLSKTLKYDHSGGFKWHGGGGGGNVYGLPPNGHMSLLQARLMRLASPSQRKGRGVDRRASMEAAAEAEGCSANRRKGRGGQCQAPRIYLNRKEANSNRANIMEDFLADNSNSINVDDYLEDQEDNNNIEDGQLNNRLISEIISGADDGDEPVDGVDHLQAIGSEPASSTSIVVENPPDRDHRHTKPSHKKIPLEILHQIHKVQRIDPAEAEQLLKDFYADSSGGQITAKLHNIGIHQDHDHENSIVISQVVVSPLQATYGKAGSHKVGKIFCPPHKNFRLQRERTVRLRPNLIGKCHHNHHHDHLGQPIRVY